FARKDQKTGKAVTSQRAEGSNTTYGHGSAIDVHGYQMIEANQRTGSFKPSDESGAVDSSMEKDKEYVDAAEVIPVDDRAENATSSPTFPITNCPFFIHWYICAVVYIICYYSST